MKLFDIYMASCADNIRATLLIVTILLAIWLFVKIGEYITVVANRKEWKIDQKVVTSHARIVGVWLAIVLLFAVLAMVSPSTKQYTEMKKAWITEKR